MESLRTAVPIFEKLLGRPPRFEEVVEEQKVRVAVFELGEARIELLEATSADSPVAKFLARRGQGVHHLALAVPDFSAALGKIESAGLRLIDRSPRRGAEEKKIAFLHPSGTAGVLIELTEEN